MSIEELNPHEPGYFKRLRLNPHFHLGMGDVRLTLGMQQAIEQELARLQCQLTDAECRLEEMEQWRKIDDRRVTDARAALEKLQEALK